MPLTPEQKQINESFEKLKSQLEELSKKLHNQNPHAAYYCYHAIKIFLGTIRFNIKEENGTETYFFHSTSPHSIMEHILEKILNLNQNNLLTFFSDTTFIFEVIFNKLHAIITDYEKNLKRAFSPSEIKLFSILKDEIIFINNRWNHTRRILEKLKATETTMQDLISIVHLMSAQINIYLAPEILKSNLMIRAEQILGNTSDISASSSNFILENAADFSAGNKQAWVILLNTKIYQAYLSNKYTPKTKELFFLNDKLTKLIILLEGKRKKQEEPLEHGPEEIAELIELIASEIELLIALNTNDFEILTTIASTLLSEITAAENNPYASAIEKIKTLLINQAITEKLLTLKIILANFKKVVKFTDFFNSGANDQAIESEDDSEISTAISRYLANKENLMNKIENMQQEIDESLALLDIVNKIKLLIITESPAIRLQKLNQISIKCSFQNNSFPAFIAQNIEKIKKMVFDEIKSPPKILPKKNIGLFAPQSNAAPQPKKDSLEHILQQTQDLNKRYNTQLTIIHGIVNQLDDDFDNHIESLCKIDKNHFIQFDLDTKQILSSLGKLENNSRQEKNANGLEEVARNIQANSKNLISFLQYCETIKNSIGTNSASLNFLTTIYEKASNQKKPDGKTEITAANIFPTPPMLAGDKLLGIVLDKFPTRQYSYS